MTTLADALTEEKSPKTIRWIMSSVTYFREFLWPDGQDIDAITGNDLRRFIIELQQRPKFLKHLYPKPRQDKLTAQPIETYVRPVQVFFGYLHREELINHNPMVKVKMPRLSKKVVPTFSNKEVERRLAAPETRNLLVIIAYAAR